MAPSAIFSSFMMVPPRICSFCALFRNDAFSTKSTVHRPRKRHVGAVDELPGAHLRDHMPQALLAEDHRVGHDLRPEVFLDRPLLRAAHLRLPRARAVGASHVTTAGSRRRMCRDRSSVPGTCRDVPS